MVGAHKPGAVDGNKPVAVGGRILVVAAAHTTSIAGFAVDLGFGHPMHSFERMDPLIDHTCAAVLLACRSANVRTAGSPIVRH